MDFFSRQRASRQRSGYLLLSFVVALLGIGLFIHVSIGTLAWQLGDSPHPLQPSMPATALIAIVWLAMLFGAFFRYLDVKGGGACLAARFGATQVEENTRDQSQRELLRVVAEMAIASASPMPDVFVLRQETAINALVVGTGKGRNAIIVSRGALDAFDREQLQAVVAHEFGHIANGDLVLNMRLLMVLGGLLAVDEIGRLLIGDEPNESAHPGVFVGYLLLALGSVGLLAGSILRAAFSRQREYLADASAVQFTRDPTALAAALALIAAEQTLQPPHGLHGVHARELAHLCIQGGSQAIWYRRWLDSHPPLSRRIAAIDPHHAVRRRRPRGRRARADQPVPGSAAPDAGQTEVRPAAVGAVQGMVPGKVVPAMLAAGMLDGSVAANPVAELDDHLSLLLMDDQACIAALFALFCTPGSECLVRCEQDLASRFSPAVAERIARLADRLEAGDVSERLQVIEHVTARLCRVASGESRRHLFDLLETGVQSVVTGSLSAWTELQIIRLRLSRSADTEPHRDGLAAPELPLSFEAMSGHVAVLLSQVIEASGASEFAMDAEFARAMSCYTASSLQRRRGDETGTSVAMQQAFDTICSQPLAVRQAVVEHCREIVMRDSFEAPAEQRLLRLISAALDCPVQRAA